MTMIMNKVFLRTVVSGVLLGCAAYLSGQTIAEKKAGVVKTGGDLDRSLQKHLQFVNKDLSDRLAELKELYRQVGILYERGASEKEYAELLSQINETREELNEIEEGWREMASSTGKDGGYALWHQPETTLGQLVVDYGSQQYVYLVPEEISEMKLSIDSNLPIPKASWDEMLELIFTQNGVGMRQLNPFLRQLYLVHKDRSGLKVITNKRDDLSVLPPNERVSFILEPEPAEVKRVWAFMERFVNPNSTSLQLVGRDIVIVGNVNEVQDLLKIYDFISVNKGEREYKAIALRRVDAEEMANILGSIFEGIQETNLPQADFRGPERNIRPKTSTRDIRREGLQPASNSGLMGRAGSNESGGSTLRVIALKNIAQAVFLVGTREEIRKAEEIIRQVENQVGSAREKVIYSYTIKHADPEELANVVDRIYNLMIQHKVKLVRKDRDYGPDRNGDGVYNEEDQEYPGITNAQVEQRQMDLPQTFEPLVTRSYPFEDGYFLTDRFVVNDDPGARNRPRNPPVNQGRSNFIIDPKTSILTMVVEADILPKIKELIKKIDVPVKMVQLEVLLFERSVSKQDDIGLNLLRIGTCASNTNKTCAFFSDIFHVNPFTSAISPVLDGLGVFQFLMSRKKGGGLPAYDFAYKFLISQDDIQINASPSVLTLNQTLATINVDEEISVNTGVYLIQEVGGLTSKDAFARARYGIKINITPTIHLAMDDDTSGENTDYVTLDTDVLFESIRNNVNDRPDVIRRNVINQVRIPDGQTVIIGGLRKKQSQDGVESIPFLGELPGIGKFFSSSTMVEDTTEMFIFITPTIIRDPVEDLDRLRCEEMQRRPGDIPCFLCRLVEARELEKEIVFSGSMTLLFGPAPDRCMCPSPSSCPCEEYDGR